MASSKVQSYIDAMGSQPAPAPVTYDVPEPVAPVAKPVVEEPPPAPAPEPVAAAAPAPTAPVKPAATPPKPAPKAKEAKPEAKSENLSGWKKFTHNLRRFANYVDKPPKE